MLRDLLLVLNMLVCLALIGVVLLQRSEGGAFGTGSPTGLVTARGAGDLHRALPVPGQAVDSQDLGRPARSIAIHVQQIGHGANAASSRWRLVGSPY